ncbi:hypothetical protein E2C01_031280 [Portunus trituberculatus]|uniref:Reverse transcriptase zinc-binding domain-containing protein n=1 Tax=Portunus trituberculatus TaxID=210409 RepID=A0A5B7EXP9_PORTR|nr:hypothetical protein [Portunus trituberculatus]
MHPTQNPAFPPVLKLVGGWKGEYGQKLEFYREKSFCGMSGVASGGKSVRMVNSPYSEVNITPFPLPLSTAKRLISRVCHSTSDSTLATGLRVTSMGQYRHNSSPQPWVRQQSHALDVALTRLCLGHTTLNAHLCDLHRLRLAPDPHCPWCRSVPETIEHFLLQCPRFHSQRVLLRAQLLAFGASTLDLPTLQAAAGVHPTKQHAVLRLTSVFLKKTGQLSRL